LRSAIKHIILCLCLVGAFQIQAQERFSNETKVTRILFIFDGSGSMTTKWGEKSKYEIAKELVTQTIDSIEKVNRNVEFGLRVFGHQSPRVDENCEDSKLEVGFQKYNGVNIGNKLDGLTPQGQTPIAYSIFQCLMDFPRDRYAKNSIILVTDGAENCEGDLCALNLELEKRKITMKPFIIGMGLKEDEKSTFDCIGTFIDAKDEKGFDHALNAVVSQSMHNTTTTVNLINKKGIPDETDVEMTFYDSWSGEQRYNLVHTMNIHNRPDTLHLNPVGKYDITVHSIPSVSVKGIELTPGRHNTVGIDVPQGTLNINWRKLDMKNTAPCLIRKSGTDSTIHVQNINSLQKYLVGKYDVEVLTVPRKIFKDVVIKQSEKTDVLIRNQGSLNLKVGEPGHASIYQEGENGNMNKIYEFNKLMNGEVLRMLPGAYILVYQPKSAYEAEMTVQKRFNIRPNVSTPVLIQ